MGQRSGSIAMTMILLNDKQKECMRDIAKKYGIRLFVLFGSYATGQEHAKSDVDIAYQASQLLALEQEACLATDLSVIFNNDCIDLVAINIAPPLLRYAIFKDGIPLYEKKRFLFASFSSIAFKQYIEAKPLFIEQARRLKENI